MSAFDPKSHDGLTDIDVREFQKLYKRSFRKKLSDNDARAMATRMLALYRVLYSPTPEEEQGSRLEQYPELPGKLREVLHFIQESLVRGHSPSVREVAGVMGCKSSRTAFRAIDKLIKRGYLKRDKNGRLCLVGHSHN